MPTVTLTIRGTRYYRAEAERVRGLLVCGAPVVLRHKPSNPHDPNAVAIILPASDSMLGHVSKELAPKYVRLLRAGAIKSATVTKLGTSVDRVGVRPVVHVAVNYLDQQTCVESRAPSGPKVNALPAQPGVYTLTCKDTGRVYVGSSHNVRERIKGHFADLKRGQHDNPHLQADFQRYGIRAFQPSFVLYEVDKGAREKAEQKQIAIFLARGSKLYNMTYDGQGAAGPGADRNTPSISDRGSIQKPPTERISNSGRVSPVLPPSTALSPVAPSPAPAPLSRQAFQVVGAATVGIFLV